METKTVNYPKHYLQLLFLPEFPIVELWAISQSNLAVDMFHEEYERFAKGYNAG